MEPEIPIMGAGAIKRFCSQYRISRLELAATCGLPESYLAGIEDGVYEPLDSDLARIQKALRLIRKSQEQ
jgi:predicted transcriptional regulator